MNLNIAEIKKRFQPRTSLALTLESERVAVSVLSEQEGSDGVFQTFSIPVGSDEISREPEKAGAMLAAALNEAQVRHRAAVVRIPPGWAMTASIDLPDVSAEDLRSYLELSAEREFPVAVSDLRLAHSPYTMPDGRRRATLAAVPAKRIEAVGKMLAAAGCRPVSISLSLYECLSTSKPTLYFLANGTHTDVVITAGGGVVSMRSLAGLTHSDEVPFDPVSFYREIRITLGRLPEPIRQQLGDARFGGTPSSARRLFTETRDSLRKLGIENAGLDSNIVEGKSDAATVQTVESFLSGQPVPFEFIVPEVNRWQVMLQRFDSKRHRLIVGGVVCFLVLPLLVLFIRHEQENHLENEWNDMKRNVAELDGLQQKIHQFRPWFEPEPQILKIMESVIAAFPDQGDVWAKSIQVTDGNKLTCTGFARNQAVLLALLERLRALPGVNDLQRGPMRGDNPVQFSFTCKWEAVHEN
ncbi:MAG: hypothetical protein WCD79_15360 [Chthoniobacteraceae bacterium]